MYRKTWAKKTRIMIATVWGSLPEEARHQPEHICSLFDYLSNGSTLKAGVKKALGQEQTSHTLSSHSIYHYFICMCDMCMWKKCMAVRSQLYRIKHKSSSFSTGPASAQPWAADTPVSQDQKANGTKYWWCSELCLITKIIVRNFIFIIFSALTMPNKQARSLECTMCF